MCSMLSSARVVNGWREEGGWLRDEGWGTFSSFRGDLMLCMCDQCVMIFDLTSLFF